jgi:hypothetical protein
MMNGLGSIIGGLGSVKSLIIVIHILYLYTAFDRFHAALSVQTLISPSNKAMWASFLALASFTNVLIQVLSRYVAMKEI